MTTKIPVELSSTPGIVDGSNATAITIDSSENVGIGTTSPSNKLHVTGSGSTPFATQRDVNSGGFAMLQGKMGDSASTTAGHAYSALVAGIEDNTNGAEDGYFAVEVSEGGSGSEKLRIKSNGNVGIGTTSPSYKLTINSADEDHLRFENGSEIAIIRLTDAGILDFWAHGSDEITFTNGTGSGTERMRINSIGGVAINNTSPHHAYEAYGSLEMGHAFALTAAGSSVNGNIMTNAYISSAGNWTYTHSSQASTLQQMGNGVTAWYRAAAGTADNTISWSETMRIDSSGNLIVGDTAVPNGSNSCFSVSSGGTVTTSRAATNSQTHFLFMNPNGGVGSIRTNASATAFNTSSDARLKDVTGSARGLEVINALNPVAYNWKVDGKADEGLIAQEVLDIVPNAVSGSEEEYYQMDYSKLVTPLVKAIQEQQEQIEQLKAEIQTLKGE